MSLKATLPHLASIDRIVTVDPISPGTDHLGGAPAFHRQRGRVRVLAIAWSLPPRLPRVGVEANHKLRGGHPLAFVLVEERTGEAIAHQHQGVPHQHGRVPRAMVMVVGHDPLPHHLPALVQARCAVGAEVHKHPLARDHGGGCRIPRAGQSLRPRVDFENRGGNDPRLAGLGIKPHHPQRPPPCRGRGQPDGPAVNDRARPPLAHHRNLPGDVLAFRPPQWNPTLDRHLPLARRTAKLGPAHRSPGALFRRLCAGCPGGIFVGPGTPLLTLHHPLPDQPGRTQPRQSSQHRPPAFSVWRRACEICRCRIEHLEFPSWSDAG